MSERWQQAGRPRKIGFTRRRPSNTIIALLLLVSPVSPLLSSPRSLSSALAPPRISRTNVPRDSRSGSSFILVSSPYHTITLHKPARRRYRPRRLWHETGTNRHEQARAHEHPVWYSNIGLAAPLPLSRTVGHKPGPVLGVPRIGCRLERRSTKCPECQWCWIASSWRDGTKRPHQWNPPEGGRRRRAEGGGI